MGLDQSEDTDRIEITSRDEKRFFGSRFRPPLPLQAERPTAGEDSPKRRVTDASCLTFVGISSEFHKISSPPDGQLAMTNVTAIALYCKLLPKILYKILNTAI